MKETNETTQRMDRSLALYVKGVQRGYPGQGHGRLPKMPA